MIFCHDKREYMTLGEYMEKYPIAYAEAVESMTAEQKALFAARFEDRYIYLPKDETSDTGENFSISANVTFVTPNADNPESIPAGGTAYWKYTVDSDAEDPVIAVTGCEWIAPADGMIFLFNPTGDITITVSASLKYYNVTLTGENCSFSPSSVRIQARGSVRVNVIPATNYKWNGTLSVTGAAAIKNVSGNYFDLMGATGDVTVSVTCDRIVYPLTVSGINCTPNPKPTQIAAGGTLAITYTAAAGYDLPEASGVGVTGCSFGWNQSTGVLTLYNPTGTVAAGVVAVAKSYAITATVTNGTATGANVIHTGETVALTIAADEGYSLPDTVNVTGASQTWNKDTGTLTLSNPTGPVTVSAVCVAAVSYPVKGDLITIESKQYRVLKTNGSVAEVLSMYNASTSVKFDTNSSCNNTYAGKNIDTYCNSTFYSGLSTAMKTAIVDKTFTQDSWLLSSSAPAEPYYTLIEFQIGSQRNVYYYRLANATYGVSITRHCYCLSIQDVLDYLECTTAMNKSDTTLTAENIAEMIWNIQVSNGNNASVLRSADNSDYSYVFNINGYRGSFSYTAANNNVIVRPAFQIDLSKIEWTKQTSQTWMLNETLDISTLDSDFTVDFVSNGNNFSAINGQGSGLDYDSTTVYYDGGPGGFVWVDQAYRTITFAQPVTDAALLAWLQANGTKQ
mgnify:CR=1 FL=1